MRPDEWTPDQAAAWVTDAWQGAVESIIETGRRLSEAKIRVGHGNWLPTVARLPFGETTAVRLMAIAKHPDISNHAHVQDLPASWGTLYVLSHLPAGEIPRRIEAHEITAEIQRVQAEQMTQQYIAALQESLNGYSEFADAVTHALSHVKTWEPPADIPDGYLPLAELKERVSDLAEIVRNWE